MDQTSLWHETIFDALSAEVHAAGGPKKVATRVWPALSPDIAAARLRSALNTEHQQKLDLDELVLILEIGKAVGNHSVMTFLARRLGYEIQPLKPEEAKKAARQAEINSLLARLRELNES
jgi:hypothetical protein